MMVAARERQLFGSLAKIGRVTSVRTIVLTLILLRTISLSKVQLRPIAFKRLGEADADALSGGGPDGT